MKHELRRVEALSAAKIFAIVQACLQLVFSLAYTVVAAMNDALSLDLASWLDMEGNIFGLLVLGPMLAAFGGYVGGIVFASVYNWSASKFGGVRITLSAPGRGEGRAT